MLLGLLLQRRFQVSYDRGRFEHGEVRALRSAIVALVDRQLAMRGNQLERVTIETEHVTVLAAQLLLTVVNDSGAVSTLLLLMLLKRCNKVLSFLSNVRGCRLSMTLRVPIFLLLI